MRRAACAAAAALSLLSIAAPYALAAAQTVPRLADGVGEDWQGEDVVGISLYDAAPSAPADMLSASAADNASHWFFRLSFAPRGALENFSFALYLFGPDDGSAATPEPHALPYSLPDGAPLLYAIYLPMEDSFPANGSLTFFDGIQWKNRTLVELSIAAARNDSAGFVELAAPRDSLLFLEAGTLAAALIDGTTGQLLDSVPDDAAHPSAYIPGRVRFYDYAMHPPIAFTALGLSDPGVVEGEPVTIFLELTNEGPKSASSIAAHVFIDGVLLGAGEGLTLLAGNGTAVLAFNWTAAAGAHNVTAVSFPGGDSRTLAVLIPGAAAELAIVSAQADPPNPEPGQRFAVRVTIHNGGNAPAQGGTVLLKDGTRVLASAPFGAIPPGNDTRVDLSASFSEVGVRTLRVEIDGVNTQNATAEVAVAVAPPPTLFGLSPLVVLVLVVAGSAGLMWYLTPRLVGGGRPRRPED